MGRGRERCASRSDVSELVGIGTRRESSSRSLQIFVQHFALCNEAQQRVVILHWHSLNALPIKRIQTKFDRGLQHRGLIHEFRSDRRIYHWLLSHPGSRRAGRYDDLPLRLNVGGSLAPSRIQEAVACEQRQICFFENAFGFQMGYDTLPFLDGKSACPQVGWRFGTL